MAKKKRFRVGTGKIDALEEFIQQELDEYLEFRKHGAFIYDAIV